MQGEDYADKKRIRERTQRIDFSETVPGRRRREVHRRDGEGRREIHRRRRRWIFKVKTELLVRLSVCLQGGGIWGFLMRK